MTTATAIKCDLDHVLLATADHEFGHVPTGNAIAEATKLANSEGRAISILHPVKTTKLLKLVKPTKKPAPAKKVATKATAKKIGQLWV